MEEKNVWQRIITTLKDNGIAAYPPATKVGQCKEPYVVVKFAGSMKAQTYSTQKDLYNFLIYVPKNKYSQLSDYETRIRSILDVPPLFPMIMPTGQAENDYFDDNMDAHLRIITYYNYKRNKHL